MGRHHDTVHWHHVVVDQTLDVLYKSSGFATPCRPFYHMTALGERYNCPLLGDEVLAPLSFKSLNERRQAKEISSQHLCANTTGRAHRIIFHPLAFVLV